MFLGFLIAGLVLGGCGGSGDQQTRSEKCIAKGGRVSLAEGRAICFTGTHGAATMKDHRRVDARIRQVKVRERKGRVPA